MTNLQEQIIKVLKFSGGYMMSADIADELEEAKKNVSSRLSELKSTGVIGYDKQEGGFYIIECDDKLLPIVKPKPKGLAESYLDALDAINLPKPLNDKVEKLAMLRRIKSMFTRCEMNQKLHDKIDEIISDYE